MRVRYGGKEYNMPPPEGFTFPRFITEEAQNKFDQIIKHRIFDRELWFPIEDDKPFYGLPKELASTIHKLNWKMFLKLYGNTINPCVSIVKEFYSCILDSTQDYVSVRGVCVYFTPNHINFHYGLIKNLKSDDDIVDEYQDLMNTATEENLSSIMKTIAVEGTDWKKEKGKKIWKVTWEALKPVPQIWYPIICNRLLHSSEFESFDRDRLLLLHCILEGRSINVGKIIHDEIINCAFKTNKEDVLLFPSLISGLCTRNGVVAENNERVLINQGVMDLDSVKRFYKEEADKRERLEEEEKFVGGDEAFVRRAIFKHMQQEKKFWGFYKEAFIYQRKMFELNFAKGISNPPEFPEDILEPCMTDSTNGKEKGKDSGTAEAEHDSFMDDDSEDSEKQDARNKRPYVDGSSDHDWSGKDSKKRSKTSAGRRTNSK